MSVRGQKEDLDRMRKMRTEIIEKIPVLGIDGVRRNKNLIKSISR